MKKRYLLTVQYGGSPYNFAVCVHGATEEGCKITEDLVVQILKQAGDISATKDEFAFETGDITKVAFKTSGFPKVTVTTNIDVAQKTPQPAVAEVAN